MPAMNRKFTIHFEPTGAGVLVTVPEIGMSTMAEDASIEAIEEAGQRLITVYLEKVRRRPSRKAKASAGYTPCHPGVS
jgi:hypothetical protein